MKKLIIFFSAVLALAFIHGGLSARSEADVLKHETDQLESDNALLRRNIEYKESLPIAPGVSISEEYEIVLNQLKLLESYSGTSMNIQLEGSMDSQDIATHYEGTEYQGIKGLRVRIVVDKFSKETDMGAVLDDIHLLEKNTDFMASEITKDNNNLIVKGEIYGL